MKKLGMKRVKTIKKIKFNLFNSKHLIIPILLFH